MVEEFPIVDAGEVQNLARNPGSCFTFEGQRFKTDDKGEDGELRVFPVLNDGGLPRMTIEDAIRNQLNALGITVMTAGEIRNVFGQTPGKGNGRTDFDGFPIATSGK